MKALVFAALLLTAGQSGAVVYKGTFDPLDFKGEFFVAVAGACLVLAPPDPYLVVYPTNSCNASLTPTMTSLHVDLLDEATQGVLASFDFPSLGTTLSSFVVSAGEVIGVNTPFIGIGSYLGDTYWVRFLTGPLASLDPRVQLYTGTCGVTDPEPDCILVDRTETFAMTRVVAEPGTLALLALALAGALTLGRRRLR